MKRFLTEYTDDGSLWNGPIILADSIDMAKAIAVCLLSPSGTPLTVIGEYVTSVPVEAITAPLVAGPRPN